MTARDLEVVLFEPEEERDLFEMANLYPRTTGLPVTVWASPRGHARHDARVKVSANPGNRMDLDETAIVAVRPQPALVHGDLPKETLDAVFHWVELNSAALIDFWDGAIDTVEFVGRLRRV